MVVSSGSNIFTKAVWKIMAPLASGSLQMCNQKVIFRRSKNPCQRHITSWPLTRVDESEKVQRCFGWPAGHKQGWIPGFISNLPIPGGSLWEALSVVSQKWIPFPTALDINDSNRKKNKVRIVPTQQVGWQVVSLHDNPSQVNLPIKMCGGTPAELIRISGCKQ